MKNEEVVKNFLRKRTASGSNLTSTGNRLISYCTCIAEWGEQYLVVNLTKYSSTTSRHLGYLMRMLEKEGIRWQDIDGVPRGVFDLIPKFKYNV